MFASPEPRIPCAGTSGTPDIITSRPETVQDPDMSNARLLAYLIARRNAEEMGRRGVRPNIVIRVLVGLACLASCVMGLAFAFGAVIFMAGFLGLYGH